MIHHSVLITVLVEISFWIIITFLALSIAIGTTELRRQVTRESGKDEYLDDPPFAKSDDSDYIEK